MLTTENNQKNLPILIIYIYINKIIIYIFINYINSLYKCCHRLVLMICVSNKPLINLNFLTS